MFQQCTYAQARHLIKLQRLRQLIINDIWSLPERFKLRNAYSELKFNTNESYFVLRAIFRMMWRPMIPVYIIGLLVQFVPLIRLRLNRNIMQHIDDFSNYSMYSIVADISRVLLVGLFNSSQSIAQGYIANEMSRAQRAINLEVFRLPLQRLGLRKKSNKDNTEGHVAELTKFPQNVQDLINSLLSVVITGTMLYIGFLGMPQ
ncbi:hypothetical protein LPJ71_001126 [Coemansia sp. S17]|nr:hypothetical protein LPJ71_001126 [Coemansia sp. S17]